MEVADHIKDRKTVEALFSEYGQELRVTYTAAALSALIARDAYSLADDPPEAIACAAARYAAAQIREDRRLLSISRSE